jgi:hypothetical protein
MTLPVAGCCVRLLMASRAYFGLAATVLTVSTVWAPGPWEFLGLGLMASYFALAAAYIGDDDDDLYA